MRSAEYTGSDYQKVPKQEFIPVGYVAPALPPYGGVSMAETP